jgi:uncharacterized protein (TIGR04255 family)
MRKMPTNEIFLRPVVKQVAFAINFPNLFFLENRIGDFQIKVMKSFPKSELLLQRHFVFGVQDATKELEGNDAQPTRKVWQFSNDKGVTIGLASDSLSIVSDSHKTYNYGTSDRFRDIIELVCQHFFEVSCVPVATRVGLRYIDQCPVQTKTTASFKQFYKSALPVDRFQIEKTPAMDLVVVVDRGSAKLRYAESLRTDQEKPVLVLDFDASAENVDAKDVLATADTLHDVVSAEFYDTAGEGLLQFMRTTQ